VIDVVKAARAKARGMRAQLRRSKAGLDRSRHAAEKPARQTVVIPQYEGKGPGQTAHIHSADITIPD
jgi:hypothetical protein